MRQTLGEVVGALDNIQVAADFLAGQALYAVVVPEDAPAHVVHSDNPQELVSLVKDQLKLRTQLFVFQGSRCPITKAPPPFLVTSSGKYPLFEIEEVVESDDGYLFQKEEVVPAVVRDAEDDEVVEQLGDPD